jgi:hypothetical protein
MRLIQAIANSFVNVVGGFVLGDFSFNDIVTTTSADGNTQTSAKSGTLFINASMINFDGTGTLDIYKNGSVVSSFSFSSLPPPFEATISIAVSDIIYFKLTRDGGPAFAYDEAIISLYNNNSSGTLIDSFTISTSL